MAVAAATVCIESVVVMAGVYVISLSGVPTVNQYSTINTRSKGKS